MYILYGALKFIQILNIPDDIMMKAILFKKQGVEFRLTAQAT